MSLIAGNQTSRTDFSANGQTLVHNVESSDVVRFEFSGTYNFTAVFEATTDGTTWFPFLGTKPDTATTSLNHAVANATQAYQADCRAVAKVRARLTAFTSAGTHKVNISSN